MNLKSLRNLFFVALGGFSLVSCSSSQLAIHKASAGLVTTKAPIQQLAPEDRYARTNEFAPTEMVYAEERSSYLGAAETKE